MTRGEIWWADLGLPFGSEAGPRRPVLVVQDDAFNRSAIATVVIVPFTTIIALAEAPGNVAARSRATGLSKDSVIVVSQLASIDRRRLIEVAGRLGSRLLREVEAGISLELGLA